MSGIAMTNDPITRLNAALEGRYRVEREIGEGGMATVYLAYDVRHNRNVALKESRRWREPLLQPLSFSRWVWGTQSTRDRPTPTRGWSATRC